MRLTYKHALLYVIIPLFAIAPLDRAIARDANSSAQEKELIALLQSSAPGGEKALACKKLAVYGTKAAVPELAKLLSDPRLASWSRIALEVIPDPSADEALRKATDKLGGKLLVGVINSIGVRRDERAVDRLAARLSTARAEDNDAEVPSAAAIALGKIGDEAATKALRAALSRSPEKVRIAVAEGCILCAERLLEDGRAEDAAQIYDEVRRADLPKQRKLEATRGAILARESQGVPLLLEQLKSSDKDVLEFALGTARQLPGRAVGEALTAELAQATPGRAVVLLGVLADRKDRSVLPAVLKTVHSGPVEVRVAAIEVLPRLGDASCVDPLLEVAVADNAELQQAAKAALAKLPGHDVDAEITSRLPRANRQMLVTLIELIGERRIDATSDLINALKHRDTAVRSAALTALGTTVGPDELHVLVSQVVTPKHSADAAAAKQALKTACVRMPDREVAAEQLLAAMSRAPVSTKHTLLEILGATGGTKALETIGAAAKSSDPELQDISTRLLGQWMDVEAAPVLLDLAKTAPNRKYQSRALRGYIRLVRQFPIPDPQRVEMSRKAFDAATTPDEKKLVLAYLGRYPSIDMLKLAVGAADDPELKRDATNAAVIIGRKLIGRGWNTPQQVAATGLDPEKWEIVKASGAPTK